VNKALIEPRSYLSNHIKKNYSFKIKFVQIDQKISSSLIEIRKKIKKPFNVINGNGKS